MSVKQAQDVEYLIKRGKECSEEYSFEEALFYFERALSLISEEDERYFPLLVELGKIRSKVGDWDNALRDFHIALDISSNKGYRRERADILRRIGDILSRKNEWDVAIAYYESGIKTARDSGDEKILGDLFNSLAIVYFEKGQLNKALRYYRKSLNLARKRRDLALLANIYNNMGAVYSVKGEYEKAIEYYKNSLRIYKECGNHFGISHAFHNLGMTYSKKGDRKRAEGYYRESLKISERIGEISLSSITLLSLAEMRISEEKLKEAEEILDDALKKLFAIDDKLGIAEGYKLRGVIERKRGNLKRAEYYLLESIKIHEECNHPLGLAESYRELGITYKEKGETEKTWRWLERAEEIFRKLRAKRDLIEVRKELEEIEKIYIAVVRQLGSSVEAKDKYTLGHSERVAVYALEIARKLNLSNEEIKAILTAAYLHDIGKVDVPDGILKKPGRLTPEEYERIKGHPLFALKKLRSISFPWDVRPLIRHHHERYDGKGYPDGLKGEEIPLGARIIAVADVFDALTSDRPYRKALSLGEAIEEMRRVSGTQLDPKLVLLFIKTVEEKPEFFTMIKKSPRMKDLDFLWKAA
jgi:putative nucleotidyltransferase with HDIG domain